jgi:two-component system sensor histidine kinase ResE
LGELDAFKTHILHTISHDLRNPLSAIATSAKLLREDALPERSRPLVDAVTTSVLRLRTMVNNILDGAHLKEGRLTFQFREVELRPLLEEVLRLFQPSRPRCRENIGQRLAPAPRPTAGRRGKTVSHPS